MSSFKIENRLATRREFLQKSLLSAVGVASGGALSVGCGGVSGPSPTRLLLSTFLLGTVEAFDPGTFRSLGTFASSVAPGVTTAGIVAGPNGNVFVFSPGGDAVYIYDKASGMSKGTLPVPPKGLITPHSGVIGSDGNLYVVNAPTLNGNVGKGVDSIERYDSITFQRLGTFATISAPFGIAINPYDQDIYVSSTLQYSTLTNETDYVTRLNSQNGTFQGIAARDIKVPFTMAFHPSGDLLVAQHFEGNILRIDISTGRLVEVFAQLPFPVGITYGPDGDLYAASFTTPDRYNTILTDFASGLGGGSVLRFDGRTGTAKGTVLTGLPLAGFIAFV